MNHTSLSLSGFQAQKFAHAKTDLARAQQEPEVDGTHLWHQSNFDMCQYYEKWVNTRAETMYFDKDLQLQD